MALHLDRVSHLSTHVHVFINSEINMYVQNQTHDLKMASNIVNVFWSSQSRLLKDTNCLFASKNHVPSVTKQFCLIFMTYSCPSIVLGCLKKKKKRKKEKMEKIVIDLADICVHI